MGCSLPRPMHRGLVFSGVTVCPPMDTFGEMNGWIALSLTLLLGQAPSPSPDERPFVEPAPRQGQTPTVEELERTAQELEVKQLRAEVELLRAQVEAQQQEDQNRIQ